MELHQVLTKSERSPAELITGRFDGVKVVHCLFPFVSLMIRSSSYSEAW